MRVDQTGRAVNGPDKISSWDRLVAWMRHNGLLDTAHTYTTVFEVQTAIHKLMKEPPAAEGELIFTDAQIALLKTLVSTAVWIRSEQLAHPNAVLLVNLTPPTLDVAVEIDTHNVNVFRLRSEFEAGQQLFTLLDVYCEQHAIPEPVWKK